MSKFMETFNLTMLHNIYCQDTKPKSHGMSLRVIRSPNLKSTQTAERPKHRMKFIHRTKWCKNMANLCTSPHVGKLVLEYTWSRSHVVVSFSCFTPKQLSQRDGDSLNVTDIWAFARTSPCEKSKLALSCPLDNSKEVALWLTIWLHWWWNEALATHFLSHLSDGRSGGCVRPFL